MKLFTSQHTRQSGWIQKLPLEMNSANTLILTFAGSNYINEPSPLIELGQAFPQSIFIGCSTAGEILGPSIRDESICLAIAKFDHTSLKMSCFPISSTEDSFPVGEKLAKELNSEGLAGVLILSDGLLVNGSELLKGMNSILPPSIVISGGLAGDGSNFKKTWVIKDRKPQSGYITAVGFYGSKVKIVAGSMGGWDVFGPERLVTKSIGNILFELDGRPALSLYKEYLGDRAAELPSSALLFPLSLRSENLERKGLVRTVLAVDETNNSMIFAGDVPEGSYAQLMKANFNRLIEGAAGAARLVSGKGSTVSGNLAIAISCVGRRLVLGTRTESETEATLEILPKGTQQIGFYSYGEISPLANGKCDLHNQTMTLTTIAED